MPTYRDVDLALLVELTRRGKDARPSEVYAGVAKHFPNLTEEDLARTRPDGRTKVFKNMVHWARNHLRVRGLLAELPPGRWAVNASAIDALIEDLHDHRIPPDRARDFVEGSGSLAELLGRGWATAKRERGRTRAGRSGRQSKPRTEPEIPPVSAPSGSSREAAKRALLERLGQMEGYEFEQLVGRVLDSLGFRDTQVMGRSGDEGIDVLTYLSNPLVTAKVAVQVKRHSANVGPKDVSYLRDRWAHRADKLLFITTSDFSPGAREVAADSREKQVELVSGEQLVEAMLEHGLGVRARPKVEYDIDEDYLSNL